MSDWRVNQLVFDSYEDMTRQPESQPSLQGLNWIMSKALLHRRQTKFVAAAAELWGTKSWRKKESEAKKETKISALTATFHPLSVLLLLSVVDELFISLYGLKQLLPPLTHHDGLSFSPLGKTEMAFLLGKPQILAIRYKY